MLLAGLHPVAAQWSSPSAAAASSSRCTRWLRERAVAGERTRGRCRIDDLAREVGLSPRHLRDLLAGELGATPKGLSRAVVGLPQRLLGLLDAVPLVGRLEPSLTTLEPTLRTLAETTSPGEVAALTRMADHLPEIVTRVEEEREEVGSRS